ncbi:MAG: hypothetical protein SWQ30_15640 [Thermodesulfobacteriota bacterium]|nr:hypothetical protein [Thermodesulfobacteriota bacterium]
MPPEFLRRRYKGILGSTGVLFRIVSLVILSPLLCLPFYTEEFALSLGFVLPGLALFVIGWALSRICLSEESFSLTYEEGPPIIVLSWMAALIAGAVLFFIILKLYGFVKSPKTPVFVIPAKAGIQSFQQLLDAASSPA